MVDRPDHINYNYVPYGKITLDKVLKEQETNARELETKKQKVSRAANSLKLSQAIKQSSKNIMRTQKAAAKQVENLLKELTQDIKELKQLVRSGFADFNSDMIALIRSSTTMLSKQQQANKLELLSQAIELDKQVHIELKNYYELSASSRQTLGAVIRKSIFELNVQIDIRFKQLSEQFNEGFRILNEKILRLQESTRLLLEKLAQFRIHFDDTMLQLRDDIQRKFIATQANYDAKISRQAYQIQDLARRIAYRY